ncbi:MAG: DUF1559 domain-containing protein [Armatimonadetes bacterium]|nr:DUF1559 domain-containing protein [Armatimonadota bacterium]
MRTRPEREYARARRWVGWGGYGGDDRSPPRRFRRWELALVLGGIAVCALVLRPVFCGAREYARQSSCLSNEKQLALALLQYCQEYDGLMPAPSRGRGSAQYMWRRMLDPYVPHAEMQFCPTHRVRRGDRWSPTLFAASERFGLSSYGANALHAAPGRPTELFNDRVFTGDPALAKALELLPVNTADTIMFGETDGLPVIRSSQPGHFAPGALDAPSLNLTRHNAGANYAYADGHARWMRARGVQCGSGGGKDGCPWSIE